MTTPDPTSPRTSLIAKIPVPAMTSRVKKYVHAGLMAALSGALNFLAFPGWTTWSAYQLTRVLGIALFGYACWKPAPELRLT